MMPSKSEHDLIEDVDEANAKLAQYRRLCRNLSLVIIGSVSSILAGAPWASPSWLGWWAVFLGFVFAAIATVCLITTVANVWTAPKDGNIGDDHPAALARAAHRRHRDYLAKKEITECTSD